VPRDSAPRWPALTALAQYAACTWEQVTPFAEHFPVMRFTNDENSLSAMVAIANSRWQPPKDHERSEASVQAVWSSDHHFYDK
jgi:hypothetical protein